MSDITLYELTNEKGGSKTFSPHVWKTKANLAFLGVKATGVKWTFPEIRGQLSKESGNDKVTVPTIKSGDEYITDSWEIALYLDEKYGSESKRLFPGGQVSVPFIKFIENWVNTTLAAELRPLIGIKVFESLDDESTQWWIENRFKNDLSISDQWKRNVTDPELVKKYTDQARDRLSIIQDLLQFNRDQGNGRTWLGGAYPSHADALLFGFYAFSRLNEDIKRLVWEHESLPLVRQWVKDVVSLVGEEELP